MILRLDNQTDDNQNVDNGITVEGIRKEPS